MVSKEYEKVLLFMGVLSSVGFPDRLRSCLEEKFGNIVFSSSPIPFDFTSYYDEEMGEGIKRFFIAFSHLVDPDALRDAKLFTNAVEFEYAEGDNRKINLDPGTLSVSNIILATTKNRAHRIAIGSNLYAEVTLIYHHKGFESFSWTYSDYRSPEVQDTLLKMRKKYLELLKAEKTGQELD